MLVKKQKTFSLLDTDDEDDYDGDRSSAQVVYESRKDDSHKKRFRKKVLSQEDEDDEIQSLSKQQVEIHCIFVVVEET
ncbi:pre-mRNA-splicing factor ATP-dependent RNA helicase DEAH1-like isoform X2 [Prunus dulcis]|uniref:pre-mRNA-splicing factor ATP-dependent RNA helicase DEAH1-like isoform X2 n=1 Tax=Prunus dulcis TaxID=3755 RepID=UPI001482E144|nr:pre-mRNA-splicing factor ATP-dependent RNA helicase DEAH1-like isoform X2 [Prunus dulcis]